MSNNLIRSNSYFEVYRKQIPTTTTSTTTSNVTNVKSINSSTTSPSLATRSSISSNSIAYTQEDDNDQFSIKKERNNTMAGKGLTPRPRSKKSIALSYNPGEYSIPPPPPPGSQHNSGGVDSETNNWDSAYNTLNYESMTSDLMYKSLSTRIDSLAPSVSTSSISTSNPHLSNIPRRFNFSRPSSAIASSLPISNFNSNLTNCTTSSSSNSSIKSIDEIVSRQQQPAIRRSNTAVTRKPPPSQIELVDDSDQSRSSMDSLGEELTQSLKFPPPLFAATRRTSDNISGENLREDNIKRSPSSTDYLYSPSFRLPPPPSSSISTSPSVRILTPSHSNQNLASSDLATLLKSPRLTKIITLQRTSPLENILLSYADVGISTGHVILISLGLGCTRYLIGLYDELATILGLRLIVIDRPGYGQSSELQDDERSFYQWSLIINEVLSNHLNIEEYSILAHSAGCPYSLSLALLFPKKVKGRIHLLAPWVLSNNSNFNEVETLVGSYRLLKFVPASVLKKVQEVEWKVQEFKIGKPPTISSSSSSSSSLSQLELGIVGFDRNNGAYEVDGLPSLNISPNGVTYFNNKPFVTVLGRSPSLTSLPSNESRNLSTPPPSSTTNSTLRTPSPSSFTNSQYPTTTSPPTSPSKKSNSNSNLTYSNALLQASHAESLNGTTADLRVLLSTSASGGGGGINYIEIKNEVKIWLGDKDEKISLSSIRWLGNELMNCQVEIVSGGNHNLMTSKYFLPLSQSRMVIFETNVSPFSFVFFFR